MWIITAGFLTYFPEYRGLGQGYIVKYRDYDQIFASFDKSPLELLKRSRLISVVINSILLLIAHRLLCYLYGNAIAWAVTLMIAFDPYFLGHSRLLNHEAMMSLFLLVSLLAAMIFIENNPHWIFWVTASISAGFALLTKSPSIVIIPMVSLILGIKYISRWKKQRQPILLLHYVKWIILFLGILSLTFAILWPGMWVAPGKMLNGVFGNDLSYIFQGAQMNVANERYSIQFSLDSNDLTTYLTYLLWRTTPIAWLGVLFACIGLFTKDNPTFKPLMKRSIVYFGLLALIFILIFGIAKGRNSSHYILMSFVCLDVIAGIGLVGALRW